MASPLSIFISPCELKIDILLDNIDLSIGVSIKSPTDRRTCRKYVVTNTSEELPLKLSKPAQKFEGYLSPTGLITIPKAIREDEGIPEGAKYYAFLHPPIGLIDKIDLKQFSSIVCVALNGGFVYFDDNYKFLSVNAISRHADGHAEGENKLTFSGPYELDQAISDRIKDLKRPRRLVLELFHEAGFVAQAWVRGDEYFQSRALTDKLEHESGAFIFYRDDGSAIAYILNLTGHRDRSGDVGVISDVIQASMAPWVKHAIPDLISPHKHSYSIREWRKNIINMDKDKDRGQTVEWNKEDTSIIPNTINDKKTLMHLACHAGLGLDFIKKLLSNESGSKVNNRCADELEIDHLSHQDELEWTPLHYACRFSPEKTDLIEYLIEKCPKATIQADKYGRYPLHIACDSRCTKEVITLLLRHHSSEQISKATNNLGRLPIHIACVRRSLDCDGIIKSGDLDGIIELLLEKDKTGEIVRAETVSRRLPLHSAVQMKLSSKTIKLLLDKDKKWKSDIYSQFNGMIPLHKACWNNSSPETIKLLLDKDETGSTIDIMVDREAWTCHEKNKMEDKMDDSIDYSPPEADDSTLEVALHLAAEHGLPDVIHYLIKKEREKRKCLTLESITKRDCNNKFPLHIACENNVDTRVIEMLLQEDPLKETFRRRENQKSTPIHSLCANKEAKKETLEILISAERQCVQIGADTSTRSITDEMRAGTEELSDKNNFPRSTWTTDGRKRSPLYLAVKAGASDEVLDVLLRPESFYLKGFDDEVTNELAARVNNISELRSTLQDHIIERLADRAYFIVLLIEGYSNFIALGCLLRGSERLLNGTITYVHPTIISICVAFFVLMEVVQIRSQFVHYLVDVWSWQQIACTGLLVASVNHMFEAARTIRDSDFDDFTIKRNLLIFTGGMLIIQFIFFLRSTFLPFARFVGALLLIFNTLIPFLIVSLLLLVAFAYSFRVIGEEECISLGECYLWVLQGFFSGADDTRHILDVIFGVVAIVVLLNVVIAIVDEAWTSAADHATKSFWNYRLDFLSEARFFLKVKKKMRIGKLEKLAKLIDNVKDIKYANDIDWSKEPYNQVLKKEQYDKPFEWFDQDLASKIMAAHSLQKDLYWIKRKEKECKCLKWVRIKVTFKWMMSCLLYLVLIILGIITAGFFWPKNFRKGILFVGIKTAYTKLEATAKKEVKEKELQIIKRKKDGVSSGTSKNKCTRCKDDDHEWFDCPNHNKNSKFYKAREAADQDRECHNMSDSSTADKELRFESDSE